MEKRVSLSSLLDWNRCQRLHHLRRRLNLRPNDKPAPLGSGGAVHRAMAEWLTNKPGVKPTGTEMTTLAIMGLAHEFGGEEARYGKYVRGAVNSLSLVPDWIWERPWQVETSLEIAVIKIGVDEWCVHGRTDIWSEGEEGIDLLDFKVSEANPLDLMLWSPQIRYYALGLQAAYPDRAVWYRYLLLPTQGRRPGDVFAWPFTQRAATQTSADLLQLVEAFVKHQRLAETFPPRDFWDDCRPAYDRAACGYCDFKLICTAVIAGADRQAVEREFFKGVER